MHEMLGSELMMVTAAAIDLVSLPSLRVIRPQRASKEMLFVVLQLLRQSSFSLWLLLRALPVRANRIGMHLNACRKLDHSRQVNNTICSAKLSRASGTENNLL